MTDQQLGLADLSEPGLKKLVDELEILFPDVFPDYRMGIEEIAYRNGQISVVRTLKERLNGG